MIVWITKDFTTTFLTRNDSTTPNLKAAAIPRNSSIQKFPFQNFEVEVKNSETTSPESIRTMKPTSRKAK